MSYHKKRGSTVHPFRRLLITNKHTDTQCRHHEYTYSRFFSNCVFFSQTLLRVYTYRQKPENNLFLSHNFLKSYSRGSVKYRVSHETWQLVNCFECLLPYAVLDINDFLHFISRRKPFNQIDFTLKSILLLYDCHILFFVILFGIKQLYKLWKKTF